jgi:hypothetical protein
MPEFVLTQTGMLAIELFGLMGRIRDRVGVTANVEPNRTSNNRSVVRNLDIGHRRSLS